ncbi:MAG: DUF308 domain-containing protein [Clostridia bacterium]|nr:DUF308 domain-containing protein [Clostridia bacterium]
MKENKKNDMIVSFALIVVGILFAALKSEMISIVMTVIGAGLIVLAIINLFYGNVYESIAEAVIGVFIIVFGWLLVAVALYVFAAVLLIYGAFKIRTGFSLKAAGFDGKIAALVVVEGIFNVALAILLLFNQGGTVDWIFIVSGIIMIAEGILGLVEVIFTKEKIEKSKNKGVKTDDGSEFHY